MFSLLRKLYDWVLSWAETRFGALALFLFAFAESSFFPVPPDVLQIALSAGKPRRAFFYATISLIGSVLGGVVGYAIGFLFWSAAQNFFYHYIPGITPQLIEFVTSKFHQNAFVAIWLSAFTPIPYKVFTITAGIAKLSIFTLVVASILGRGMRFYLVATLMFFYGAAMRDIIDKYFDKLALLFGILLVGGLILVKYLF